MNLNELDRYKLSDAVKFNARLNPRLWSKDEHLKPQVRDALIKIADDFRESLGVKDLDLKDITLSGSNAAYTYTPNSDIDLHLVVDMPDDPVYRELFDAKKYAYNNQHNIKIGGYDVELYVQDVDQPHVTQGEYSLLNNDWIQVPRRQRADVVDQSTRSKYQDLKQRIKDAIKTEDHDVMASLMAKIKQLRQSGLDQHGEFGPENLAFKMLRTQGYIQKLVDARNAAKDQELSIDERVQPRVTYGFATESKDSLSDTINQFARSCIDYLGIKKAPKIKLHTDTNWSEQTGSFGQYEPETNVLHLATSGRHTLDILRTMAHEFTHRKQAEKQKLPADAGETGSPYEDEANAMAGRIMRHWAEKHPEMFAHVPLEEASGYIPTKKQAKDPRFVMALTKDVRPGQTGKEANKLGLQTDAQGHPALLTATLNEGLAMEYDQYGNQDPTGPESPPKMPDGTIKVDVSDIYDWYKIGQKISDLKSIDKKTLGKGPPSTVLAFGSEELENMYSNALINLGLKTHDLDEPGEEDRPGSGQDIDEALIAENIDDALFEIKMSTASLRQEAAKTGALAGMEFEMIVPNVEGDNDGDQEPDYEYDQRCRSIQDAYDFFYDGDWNSRRSCDEMRNKMQEDFQEWIDEKLSTDWDSQGEEYIYQWVSNNVDESEWNPEEKSDLERTEALEEFAANVHADPLSDYYQSAYEEFREENEGAWDESDWLDDADLDHMTNIENAYSMSWPHWTSPQGGEASIEDVAQEFENAIGRDVRASGNYHSGSVIRPSPTQIRYVVEPDGSLEPDDPNDQGLEFVSPPLPIDEILSDLNKVKRWAKEYGCYTNDSTGLHINISVPNYSRENLDFVKLALLMGDKYVLDAFGRASNTYAKSALDIVKKAVRDNPADAAKLLDKMKGNMDQLATKAIHSGSTSKYTSINTKDGHIEFRSPGGDWLDQNFDQIENTLLRFTVAMSAALNPEMYRQEYLTKLYKLLSENNKGDDTIKYFSDYVAGKIPKAALRSFIKQAQLQRNIKRGKTDGQKMWWKVYKYGRDIGRYGYSVEVVATSEEEAKQKAAKEWGEPLIDAVLSQFTAEALRPYVEQPDKPGTSQTGTGTYELFDRRTGEAIPDSEFPARNQAEVNTRLDDYIDFGPHGIGTVDARLVFGVRPVADSGDTDQGTMPNSLRPTGPGPWEVYNRQTNNSVLNLNYNGEPVTDRGTAQRLAMTRISYDQYDNYGVRTRGTGSRVNIGTQTDMENRLGLPSQSATANYAVVDRQTLDPVFRFQAGNRRDANGIYGEWLAAAGLPQTTEDYGFQEIRPQSGQTSDRTDGSNINYSFRDLFGNNPTADQQQGGIVDVAPNVAQNFGGEFSGQWRILDGDTGTELFRFRSADPSQAEANRLAFLWLQQNAPDSDFREIEVVPVMSESLSEGISPDTIHKLADRKGIKWDNEPSFLALTKRLTGKAHLDDLDQAGLEKVKQYLDKPGVAEGQIDELFQQGKQNWTWKLKADTEAIAKFSVGDRDYVWQAFSHFRDDKPNKWEIQFRLVKQASDPEKIAVFGTTGTGNSAQVMSVAVDVMREFLQYYGDSVQQIAFDAKENSRIALYRKMVQRLLPNWSADEDYSPDYGLRFTLTRPKQGVAEGSLSEVDRRGFLKGLGAAENFADGRNPGNQIREKLNAWMNQDQQYEDPSQRAGFQAKVWPYIQQNIKTILADKGEKGNGDYPAAPYAAWLLVQHMDAYPQNQIEFYNALKQAIPNHPKIQFLRDRAAVNQWIMKNANNPEYFIKGKALPNPTVNVRNPAMFKDAGIVATSREEALANAEQAGNKLLVAAVNATNAQTQPSYKQSANENFADGKNPGRKGLAKKGVAEGLNEITWVKPNFDYEWDEIEFQAKQPQVPADVRNYMARHFPNKQAWMKSVRHGRPVVVSPDHGQKIRNYTDNKRDLLNALSPQSHDPEGPAKAKRVNALFDKGGPIEMPIILKTNKGLWLIGGKTRLGTANLLKGIPAKVWMIGGKQTVAESNLNEAPAGGYRLVRVVDGLDNIQANGDGSLTAIARYNGHSQRNTLHFTVNSMVGDHNMGKFPGKYVIIANPAEMPRDQAAGARAEDTWYRFNNEGEIHLGRAIVLAPEGSSVPNGIKAQYYKGDRSTAIDTAFKQMNVGFHGVAGTDSVIGIKNDEYHKDFSTQYGTGATQGGQHDGSLEGYLESIPARLQGYLGHLQKSIYYAPPGERETFVTSYANEIISNYRDDITKWAKANPQEFRVSATYFNYIIQVMNAYQAIFTRAEQAYNQQYQDYRAAEKQWKASNRPPAPGEPPPLDPAPPPKMAKWPPQGLDLSVPNIQLSYAKKNAQGVAENMSHDKDGRAVEELKSALLAKRDQLQSATDDQVYDIIDKIMTRIARSHSISGQKLHDMWVDRYKQIPDTWIMNENFADGKGPGRPGDSQRHGIPKHATMAELEKAAHAKGRKGQLARWQLNMRRGKKK